MAIIGGHTIYKIDDTDIIPIAHENNKTKIGNPDEAKWVNSSALKSKVDKNGMKVYLLDVFQVCRNYFAWDHGFQLSNWLSRKPIKLL